MPFPRAVRTTPGGPGREKVKIKNACIAKLRLALARDSCGGLFKGLRPLDPNYGVMRAGKARRAAEKIETGSAV